MRAYRSARMKVSLKRNRIIWIESAFSAAELSGLIATGESTVFMIGTSGLYKSLSKDKWHKLIDYSDAEMRSIIRANELVLCPKSQQLFREQLKFHTDSDARKTTLLLQGIMQKPGVFIPFNANGNVINLGNLPAFDEILLSDINRFTTRTYFDSPLEFIPFLGTQKSSPNRSKGDSGKYICIAHSDIPENQPYGQEWTSKISIIFREIGISNFEIWGPSEQADSKKQDRLFDDVSEVLEEISEQDTVITPFSTVQLFSRHICKRSIVLDWQIWLPLRFQRDAVSFGIIRSATALKQILLNKDTRWIEKSLTNEPKVFPARKKSRHTIGVVTIWGTLPDQYYSGGRYHALMLAEMLADLGYAVTFVTNNYPYFFDDFDAFPEHHSIEFHIVNDFHPSEKHPRVHAQHSFLIPNLETKSNLHDGCLKYVSKTKSKLHLISFETPNWFNANSSNPRPHKLWQSWKSSAHYCHSIIATTQIGMKYAKEFYQDIEQARYHQLYAPLNSPLIEQSIKYDKQTTAKSIVIFFPRTMFAEHKGIDETIDLLDESLSGWSVYFLCAMVYPTSEQQALLSERSVRFGFSIKYILKASDRLKFKIIRESRLLLFPSQFEGYGYPPIEAVALGTPCLAFDLPVLRETCKENLYYAKLGDWQDYKTQLGSIVSSTTPAQKPDQSSVGFSDFEYACGALQEILNQSESVTFGNLELIPQT